MAIPVEASSLSQITELASNPPRFPRNPTETRREPLILYIARVPGKRDIILSTLKPRLKNVTAEDVNSSLFYVHLNVPEDAVLAERSNMEDKYEGRTSTEAISRKPLNRQTEAGLPPVPVPKDSGTGSQPNQYAQPSSQLQRKPLRAPEDSVDVSSSSNDTLSPTPTSDGSTQRHPIGPRPLQPSTSVIRKPLPKIPGVENIPVQGTKIANRKLDAAAARTQLPTKTFSLTLIRRDPTSNSQWNIGKVSSQPLFDENEAGKESDSETSYGPVFVYIDTPGYTKFRNTTDPNNNVQMGASTYSGFSRQVRMIWESPSHRKVRGSIDRQATTGYLKPGDSADEAPISEHSKLGRARGYVFSSPWNGRCSFATSGGGRSLKCKHTISGNGMKIDATDFTSDSHLSAEVSEIRFNLPSATIFSQKASTTKSGRFAVSKFSHIKNKLSTESSRSIPPSPTTPATNVRSSTMTSDDDDDEDDGLDSLGQEKAGGGNRGKRVKLAKLIIHHEGLQMLDLLVAANVGIFWRIWDR